MTQEQLKDLKDSYYQGILKVREGDTWVEYQSMNLMRVAIRDAEAELVGGKPKGSRLISTGKGY